MLVTVALGNGFILTALLWGAFVAKLIDRRLRTSAAYLLVLAALSFFGIIHSAMPEGNMYLPWTLDVPFKHIPFQFATAYAILALTFIALSFSPESREPIPASVREGLE